MPRPLRSALRECFVVALLLALAAAALDPRSTREMLVELLALGLLIGVAIATAPVRGRRQPGTRVPRAGIPPA